MNPIQQRQGACLVSILIARCKGVYAQVSKLPGGLRLMVVRWMLANEQALSGSPVLTCGGLG